jgi:hypothetical protein
VAEYPRACYQFKLEPNQIGIKEAKRQDLTAKQLMEARIN